MEKQKDLNGCWARIRKEIKQSSTDRLSWTKILGMSLNRKVAILKGLNWNSDEVYASIVREHPSLPNEAKRRLKIGVAARYGEQGIVDNVNRKGV